MGWFDLNFGWIYYGRFSSLEYGVGKMGGDVYFLFGVKYWWGGRIYYVVLFVSVEW